MKQLSCVAALIGLALCTGKALATPTAQQKCDSARITAWRKYVSCVDSVVAKSAKGSSFDRWGAFATCRHRYFRKWAAFQSYTGSTCVGARFTDNGDGTVRDNLTALVWEKKTGTVFGNGVDCSTTTCVDSHAVNNLYQWCLDANHDATCDNAGGGPADGNAFTDFLAELNDSVSACFAGQCDWRLPTLTELQTILLNRECTPSGCSCDPPPSNPCIDPTLGPTQNALAANGYWSATSWVVNASNAWNAPFDNSQVYTQAKTSPAFVRAARGGL
jgi:hypothetical protein